MAACYEHDVSDVTAPHVTSCITNNVNKTSIACSG